MAGQTARIMSPKVRALHDTARAFIGTTAFLQLARQWHQGYGGSSLFWRGLDLCAGDSPFTVGGNDPDAPDAVGEPSAAPAAKGILDPRRPGLSSRLSSVSAF